ncbi:hypothetical protein BPORC_1900 [Bifidobacterium porcinum]|nr:hypothetical protein BPORC_1900 [Bifidobacterium porcinum]
MPRLRIPAVPAPVPKEPAPAVPKAHRAIRPMPEQAATTQQVTIQATPVIPTPLVPPERPRQAHLRPAHKGTDRMTPNSTITH